MTVCIQPNCLNLRAEEQQQENNFTAKFPKNDQLSEALKRQFLAEFQKLTLYHVVEVLIFHLEP